MNATLKSGKPTLRLVEDYIKSTNESFMFLLLAGYMWLYVHRPFEVWSSLGALHVERLYMAVTIVYWLLFARKSWIPNPLNAAFLALVLVVLTAWWSSLYRETGRNEVEDYLKVVVFYVLVVSTIRNERDLRRIITVFLVVTALYVMHSFWEFHNGRHQWRQGIIRMVGVGKTYADPNSFGATIVCTLPMVFPLWNSWRKWWQRGLLAVFVGVSLVCIIHTGSRMAFCGLCALGIILVLSSRYRFRLLILLAAALPIVWNALPADRQNRFRTIIDPSYGPENAWQSAQGRIEGFNDGLRLWSKNPLLGIGPGAFGTVMGHGFQTHNLYGQTLSELGTCGGAALALVLLAFLANVWQARQFMRRGPPGAGVFPYQVSLAVGTAVVLLLFMGWGGHNLFRYHWLWYGAFLVIALHCQRQEVEHAWEAEFVPDYYPLLEGQCS
ncbi:MAG: O-antigen ligase family protein [Pirellulales bacterium]|nr:O-antigen ligase family protein [Pirellulales bacterium]